MFLKGMCYSPFPFPYNPSTANNTCIFYGSDIASYNLKALWGLSFKPFTGPDTHKMFLGRNDLKKLHDLGVNLIRLYDWDPRNQHLDFLDYCYKLGISVLVPVSNYNLGVFGEAPNIDISIKNLIRSFTVRNESDYHPAIYGVLMGNEIDLQPQEIQDYLVEYTQKWAEIEAEHFPTFRKIKVGHPVSFAIQNNNLPCFTFLDSILPTLQKITDSELDKRLMICPQTFNEASYLFDNAEGTNRGWIDLAYERYNLPILITEIGISRLDRRDYMDVIGQQLERSILYGENNPEKLVGVNYFQYCDKVWATGTS